MEKPNVINSFNILQNVSMAENATVLFYFGDIPNWATNIGSYETQDLIDFYEVIEISFNINHSTLIEMYWKIHRYIGEEFFITVENNCMNFWNGKITDDEEQWSYFDDLDNDISFVNYKKYNVQKTVHDWKNDYESLEKRYRLLHKKKSIQLQTLRQKIKFELINKIEKRLEQALNSKKNYVNSDALTKKEVDQLISLAFNDNYNGVPLLTEFLYDENTNG